MNPKLLDDLVCPRCGGFPLRVAHAEYEDGKVASGAIVCPAAHSFSIAAFVLDLVGVGLEPEVSETYDDIWRAHADQVYAGREAEYRAKFRRDSSLEGELGPYFKGARILDAGCGEGRYTYLASALGADHVVAVDYSAQALERAVRGTGNPANCSFVRADLQRLPLRSAFDYVFAFGTLQQTADTRTSFESVAALVRNGGMLSVYVYRRGDLPRVYPIVRPFTRRLPRSRVLRFADNWGFGYARAVRADVRGMFRRLGRLDVLGIGLVTFEGLTAPYHRAHKRREVERWFREAGFEVVASSHLVSVTGRRLRPSS